MVWGRRRAGYPPWVVRRTFSALLGRPSQEGVWVSGSSSTHCTNSSRLEKQRAVSTVTRGADTPCASPVGPRGGRPPDAVWHLDVFVPVDLAGQLKFTVKAPGGEQTLQESVEQPLVEFVVHPPTVDGLRHQGLERRPGDLVWRDVLPSLGGREGLVTAVEAPPPSHSRQAAACTRVPPLTAQPTLALAVSSSHVSTVSQADRRSDSPNSYFFDHPRGAYRKRSWMMAWNQASRKYKRARSLGD